MNNDFLEQFYEKVVLSRYKDTIKIDGIVWLDHGKVDLDAWAHYFKTPHDGKEYVLLYEDFPDGSFLKDGLSHDIVKCGEETSIKLRFEDSDVEIQNIIGWYTLYHEIR